jgi:hypothetical protein
MPRLRHVRLLTVAGLALSITMAVGLGSGTAFAKSQVTCSGANGTASSVTLSGCNDTAVTGGGGTSVITSSGSTINWNSGLTSIETYKVKQVPAASKKGKPSKKFVCAAGDEQLAEKTKIGKKTAASGGTATALWKDKGASTVCFTPSGGISLAPGFVLTD